jgi:hypothetical protein
MKIKETMNNSFLEDLKKNLDSNEINESIVGKFKKILNDADKITADKDKFEDFFKKSSEKIEKIDEENAKSLSIDDVILANQNAEKVRDAINTQIFDFTATALANVVTVTNNNSGITSAPTAIDPAPLLQARYIADGGNLSLNPSFTFSLPDEDLGAKFSGFFAPFLTIRENNKNLDVPPSPYVSNNFIRKFITGEPYSIVAGLKRGIISAGNLVGLEYDFDIEDREFLEPFGINPIIRKRGIGIVIYGNQTSYQRTNSAFNNLHVRDLLITVESAIEEILNNFVSDFNEDNVRLEIKTLVDNYLTGVRSVGGIYNYLTIMDSSNNTPAIIDQNIGIIDVIIEPARGIHKFINRMTVTRTGGIASGGFAQFS